MSDFELPSNIKQIGSVDENLEIYIEDYVSTYLKQYAQTGDYVDKAAFLVGKYLVIDLRPTLFICGAIQGKHTINEDGHELFTEESFGYAEEQIDKFFKDMEIVGFMVSQPEYGLSLKSCYEQQMRSNFISMYNCMFVIDPIEKLNCFYIWNDNLSRIIESSGYIIYYEKSKGMQDYIAENRILRFKAKETSQKKSIFDDEKELSEEDSDMSLKSLKPAVYKPKSSTETRLQSKRKNLTDRNQKQSDNRRVINILVTLSASLFLICFVMGTGLLQNERRISQLESDMKDMSRAYEYASEQLRQAQNTPVFADQNQPQTNNTATPETSQPSREPSVSATKEPTPQPQPVITPSPVPTAPLISNAEQSPLTIVSPATPTPPALDPDPSGTPEPTVPPAQTADPSAYAIKDTYKVQTGDSLYSISTRFYGNVNRVGDIMAANGITNPDKILIGQELKIPE